MVHACYHTIQNRAVKRESVTHKKALASEISAPALQYLWSVSVESDMLTRAAPPTLHEYYTYTIFYGVHIHMYVVEVVYTYVFVPGVLYFSAT